MKTSQVLSDNVKSIVEYNRMLSTALHDGSTGGHLRQRSLTIPVNLPIFTETL